MTRPPPLTKNGRDFYEVAACSRRASDVAK